METTTTTTVMSTAAATEVAEIAAPVVATTTVTSSNNNNNNTTSPLPTTTTTTPALTTITGRAVSCTTPPPPPPPPPSTLQLGMLVDRTSFDETDDYGVDRVALESSILEKHKDKLNSPPTTVMKNGKVRRRMRWRPKRHSHHSDTTIGGSRINNAALVASIAGSNSNRASSSSSSFRRNNKFLSSNGSVVSRSSNVSLDNKSQKSSHSFASTETFKKNNTKNAEIQARSYPLPRPNYPNTFDGVATINDEGSMVHARLINMRKNNSGNSGGNNKNNKVIKLDHLSKTSATYLQNHQHEDGNGAGMMLPPLNPMSSPAAANRPPRFHHNHTTNTSTRFQRNSSSSSCSTLTSMNSSIAATDAASSTTPLLQNYPLRNMLSNTTSRTRSSVSLFSGLTSIGGCDEDGESSVVVTTASASTAPCRDNSTSNNNSIQEYEHEEDYDDDANNPLPSLESEDLLCERRVDLRIPSSPAAVERRQTGNTSSRGEQQSFFSSSSYTSGGGGGFLPSPLANLRSRGSEVSSFNKRNSHNSSDCKSTCSSVSVEELRPSSGALSAADSAMVAASLAALEEELAFLDDPPTIVYNNNNNNNKNSATLSSSSIMTTRSKAASLTAFSSQDSSRSNRALSKQRSNTTNDSCSASSSVVSTPQSSNNMLSTFSVKREGSSLSCSVLGDYESTTGHAEDHDDGTASCSVEDDESLEMPHHEDVDHAGEMRFCMSNIPGDGGISRSYSEKSQHSLQQQQQPLQSIPGPSSPRLIALGDERTGPQSIPGPSSPRLIALGDERTGPPTHHYQSPTRHQSKPTSLQSEKEHSPNLTPPSVTSNMSPPTPTTMQGSDASSASSRVNLANQNIFRGSAASPPLSSTVPVDLDDGSFLDAEKNLMAIHEMAAEHLRHHEYSEALEVFEEILRGQLTRYGEDHFRVGTALHNIGIVHMKRGDYQEAVQVCREAVRIRRIALNPDHPDVAVSLAQLGVAYLECRKHKRAIVTFREALRIRRRNLGPKHPKVAKILNNIGCALYELNELEVAKVAFEEALEIQRETLRDMPFDDADEVPDHSLLSIASTLSNIGSIKLYWGLFDEASIDLEEALLIQQSVLGDEHPLAQRTEESLDWIDAVKYLDPAAGNNNNNNNVVQTPPENDYYSRGMMMCASPIQVSPTEDAEQQQSAFPGIIICSPHIKDKKASSSSSGSAVAHTENVNADNNDACSSITPNTGTGMPALICSHNPSDASLVRQSDDERLRSILSVMERNLTRLRSGLGIESACGGGGGDGKKNDSVSAYNMNTASESVISQPGHFAI